MATAAAPLTTLPPGEASQELALSWRRLTRVATVVAVLTLPALFVWFNQQVGWPWWEALLAALAIAIVFRGLADLLFRRVIPWPSLFGVESAELQEADVVGRRRAWFWRFWFKIGIIVVVAITIGWIFIGGTWWGAAATMWDSVLSILSSPQLWMQAVFVFFLFFANFAIMFGPLLMMNLSQMQSFEPGDAEWGVKLDDVRGQTEAKEEVRRVVDIWQSGDHFERAGGKRERGLLLFGAPGTGKTMLAKAIATGFNSPFISMPGSGFAATFIGIDAIVVRVLARRAKRLARKWGGQCIVFIDEIDAVGMRRQSLGTGAQGFEPLVSGNAEDLLFFGPLGSRDPSGDLIVETRAWRDRLFESRRSAADGRVRLPAPDGERLQLHVPRRHGRHGRRDGTQPAPRRHGRHRQPAVAAAHVHEQVQHAPRRVVHLPSQDREGPRQGSWLRSSAGTLPPRPARTTRSTSSAPRTSRSIGSIPPLIRPGRMGRHVWFRTPTKQDRLDILDLYIGKVTHAPELDSPRAPGRDRTHHERLLTRDDRAGDLDGVDDRPSHRAARALAGTTSSKP